jgi:aryl-alcohol dehydrogenase-like predicted oxidoreductase
VPKKEFRLGTKDITRIGYGAIHLCGPRAWGPPADPAAAAAVLRRAVELGVNFIDTADSYGPGSNEELIADALHPYPDGLVIATKAGQSRPSQAEWRPLGRPEYLRQQVELSLRRLKVERIDLFQLHRIDPLVPADEQFGALARLREEGKIDQVGLSEVTVEEIEAARRQVAVAAVQNLYNLADRKYEDELAYCAAEGIAFIPWRPIARGELAEPADERVRALARRCGATPAQVALAWLLHRAPVVIPIPGTASLDHLAENVAAADLDLDDAQLAELDAS